MHKFVIGIRTNTWTLMEEQLYAKLLHYFPAEDIFVIVDECRKNVKIPSFLNKISWNLNFIEQEFLLNYNHFNKGIGWLCGDYFYYAFRKNVQADYYWLIEPDVLFSFENLADFFSAFENVKDDGIFAKTRVLPKSDYWYNSASLIHQKEQTGCSFPLSRLTSIAIDLCFRERKKLSKLYKENNALSFNNNPLAIHFPNDEVLVLNTLIREALKVSDFADFFPNGFGFFGYHSWFSIPQKDNFLFKNQVIHPARPIERIKDDIIKNIVKDIDEYLSYHFITNDNVELLSSLIGSEIAQYCQKFLINKRTFERVLEISKEYLYDGFLQDFHLAKQWIYDQKTIVFDFSFKEKNPVFDFYINDNNEICCAIFDRYNNNSVWINELAVFLDKKIENGKLILIQERKIENLSVGIREIINRLSEYINYI